MRWSIGTMAVIALAAWYGTPATAQQIQEAPLPPVTPSPQAAPGPQVAQSPHAHPSTQDCVQLATPVQQTDCLNQLSSQGDYMPTPKPAPGSDMPMEFRLPLGTRNVPQRP